MRTPFLKSFLEWAALGLFLGILFCAFAVARCDDNDGWQSVEAHPAAAQPETKDTGDIADKINAKPNTGSGVIWKEKAPAVAAPAVPVAPAPAPAVPARAAALPAQLPARAEVAAPAAGKYLLKSSRKAGSTDLVETLLEVTGDVKQVAADMKEVKDKMEVVAGFRYEERIADFAPTGKLTSVRQYNLAKSKMKIGDKIKTPELDSGLQTIVCSMDKENVSLFSPRGSLRGEQLLLIEDIPGNTLTVDRLLPNKEIAVGETWKISDNVLRSFLSIDAVQTSSVEAVLTAVADNMAMVEVVGDVSGVYLGAATEMTIRAKLQFDLTAKRINWLGVMIEENRSIGHVGPGLDLIARLQIKISPIAEPKELTDDFMTTVALKPTAKTLQLKYDGGKGPWRFSHDRSWYVYQDDPQTTVLRKLTNGELTAQCNIADMGTVDVKTMTSLQRFQQDLIAGLGKNFGKTAAASEYIDERGNKVYKILLDGTVDELSLRWIYYLLTDSEGRQSVVVFVVEAAMLDQFGNADEDLLTTYRLGK